MPRGPDRKPRKSRCDKIIRDSEYESGLNEYMKEYMRKYNAPTTKAGESSHRLSKAKVSSAQLAKREYKLKYLAKRKEECDAELVSVNEKIDEIYANVQAIYKSIKN